MSDLLKTDNSLPGPGAAHHSAWEGLHYLVESAVEHWAQSPAVRFGGETLSYTELNRRANQWAHYLRDLGVGPDVIVGVLMDRSIEMVVALLAILKAGGAYLPLATDYPPERLGFILKDSGVSIVLTRSETAASLTNFNLTALSLDTAADLLSEMPTTNPDRLSGPADLAYVIYTSGSTGKPKGCLIEHAAICNRLLWMRDKYAITQSDRILQKTPYTFDVSVWEFFLPLISGATLVLAKPGGHKDNAYLQELIEAEGITACHFVPSMLRFFLRQIDPGKCASLRNVFASGEALPYGLMQQFLRTLPSKLHNLYGPTEAAVDVTYWECAERPDQKAPIGRAIDNIQIHILDATHRPVAPGEPGELYIGGIGVGRGYLNRPELTRERFIKDPFSSILGARLYRTGDKVRLLPDGEIDYIGRLDFQVKLRGFRIELGEIEETLRSHAQIEDAAVLMRDETTEDPKLVAYLVFKGAPLETKDVRSFVKSKLPEYMVPNAVVAVPAFAMSAHGKLDRAALPWPVTAQPMPVSDAAPSAPPERKNHRAESVFSQLADAEIEADLRGLFQKALALAKLDDAADLFDLGATSFTMVQAVEHIRLQYGVAVPVEVFFDTPTVKALAAYVQARSSSSLEEQSPSAQLAQSKDNPASPNLISLKPAAFKATAYAQGQPTRQFTGCAVPLGALGRMLSFLRCSLERKGPKHLYSSAGGLRSVQVYLHVREEGVSGLAEGCYYYHPQEHRLYLLTEGKKLDETVFCPFDRQTLAGAGFSLFLVGQMAAIQPIYGNASPVLTLVEAGYMGQALLEHQANHGVGLCPVGGVDFESIRDAFQLEPTHRFLHCLLGGMPAENPVAPAAGGLAEFLDVNKKCLHGHCRSYEGEKTFSHFLAAENRWEDLPTIEQKENLHRQQRHLRNFDGKTQSVPLTAWEPNSACYLLRAAKRIYRKTPVSFERFSRFMALMAEDSRDATAHRLYPSIAGNYPIKIFVYIKPDGVDALAEGLYCYRPERHSLELVARTLSADLKICYTPFNRNHYRFAKFCVFLVGDTAKLKPVLGADSTYVALLESGYIGQLLLDRQAEFEMGVCPIGGMRYEKIRDDFKLGPEDVFLHSFVCGEVAPECAISWEKLEGTDSQVASSTQLLSNTPKTPEDNAIAVVGISGRFPSAADISEFARNLTGGKCAFKEVRLNGPSAYRSGDQPKGSCQLEHHWGGFLDNVDCFDAQLFRITPAEARTIDPQERLFLETAWECLENGGYTGAELNRVAGRVGVFVGAMWDDYQHYHDAAASGPGTPVSALHSSIANRVSFYFDFKGPSVAVNTSCSSAMSALHFGCQSVLKGECGAALVGGVNLMAHPYHHSVLGAMDFLSKDGVCRPFGLKANGWVPGEGVGAVLLKRVRDAIRDGDTIHGIILGTSISHSGRTGRYGAPGAAQQAQSMRQALADAGVAVEAINYVEAAAPGAGMADASEAAAIKDVFGQGGKSTVRVGSIKGNIGHLESASAMSQLAKVLLQLKQKRIFPTLEFQPVNPLVQWEGTGLTIPDAVVEWPQNGPAPRCAIINAYGATGSAGHAVIQEYDNPALTDREVETLIVLSAATTDQLTRVAGSLHAFLNQPESDAIRIEDIGHTLRVGREPMKARLATVVKSRTQLRDRLDAFLSGTRLAPEIHIGEARQDATAESVEGDLHAMAAAWVVGSCRLPNLGSGCRRVPLPTYPFVRDHFWIGAQAPKPVPLSAPATTELRGKAVAYLKGLFSRVTDIPIERLQTEAMFDDFGMTSYLVNQLNGLLRDDFGELSAALLFERQTIGELADYLIAHHLEKLRVVCGDTGNGSIPHRGDCQPNAVVAEGAAANNEACNRQLAVVGISGRYPKARDLFEFWDNLKRGIDCITEIPVERWNDARLQADAGKHSRWGGFIDGVDEFDPFFFKISPREAQEMDPQERLFLQTVWHLFEDAGCVPSRLSREQRDRMGVFVGVMYGEYQLHSQWDAKDTRAVTSLYGSIANRVSYTFDFHGPSMAVDTLCSSSLTALHLAAQSIASGECDSAVVGGVNLSIHPNKYLLHARMAMSSTDGHCRSFGKGGDGFVPGEGVGAVLIKPLDRALKDGDQIYGIIRATAVNHDGKTHGYTVPNPNAQAAMISTAIRRAGVNPRHISYVEAHGTGTALGDPIEILGLSKAFGEFTTDTQFCAIGSVKSNIGHLESAAGMAGLAKVLLQMRHRQQVPSLHSRELNPEIQFEKTPFFVAQELTDWNPQNHDDESVSSARTRIACLSSFGAGGANAHVIVEDYADAAPKEAESDGPQLIILSAKDPERLVELVKRLHDFVEQRKDIALADLAYTLQVGREALEERVAFMASSVSELLEKLATIRDGRTGSSSVYRGRVDRQQGALGAILGDEDLQQSINAWIDKRKLDRLLPAWIGGAVVDWQRLHAGQARHKLSLPGYPFARERYWVPKRAPISTASAAAASHIHPLLHRNTSDLWELRFSSTFDGSEFFLSDHRLKGARVLPAAACLELARAALEQATGGKLGTLHLKNVAWVHPFAVSNKDQTLHIRLNAADSATVQFEIYTLEPSSTPLIVSQGTADFSPPAEAPRLDLQTLMGCLPSASVTPDRCYEICRSFGLEHGPAFRVLSEIRSDGASVLARIGIPPSLTATRAAYALHPSLLDGAFQTTVVPAAMASVPRMEIPYAVDEVVCHQPCGDEMWVYMRNSETGGAKLDLDLCDPTGTICAAIRGFSSRAIEPEANQKVTLFQPVLRESVAEQTGSTLAFARRHILTVGADIPTIEAPELDGAAWVTIDSGGDFATRFETAAARAFELVKGILAEKKPGPILTQVLVASPEEDAFCRALIGLLRTAHHENPEFYGQLIDIGSGPDAKDLAELLVQSGLHPEDDEITWREGRRSVASWDVVNDATAPAPPPWKEGGVYLITGGGGALGLLFAEEIARATRSCTLVLAGRSLLKSELEARIQKLNRPGVLVQYKQADLSDRSAVETLVQTVLREHGRINGILHAAGVVRDGYILKKTADEVRTVLAPKIRGAVYLDQATRDVALDFFALFSSTVGVLGNAGQADYAMANAFLDVFAERRNALARNGERRGHTLSVNWPLWKDGGMSVPESMLETVAAHGGLNPLQAKAGLEAFNRACQSGASRIWVRTDTKSLARSSVASSVQVPAANQPRDNGSLRERALLLFRTLLASTIESPLERIKVNEPFDSYGIDSVMVMQITRELEKTFGSLSKTLFFEYHTIGELTNHFLEAHGEALARAVGEEPPLPRKETATPPPTRRWNPAKTVTPASAAGNALSMEIALDIAIIGLAGRYPQANDLETFWRNLSQGRDCVTDIPLERWDWKRYYDPSRKQPGGHYGKRGGFIEGVDRFDPLFFNIAPRDARYMDPQERLFLETTWAALEDAGYRPRDLRGTPGQFLPSQVGVYVGVMYSEYQLHAHERTLAGKPMVAGNIYASIANRVSYFLDLHGPSMTIDTMCSSSLTGIHLACLDLKNKTTDLALAGGVNISIHPNKFLILSEGQFISARGSCASFGEGGDGYVPGEGVGAVVLKRLADAIRDGDHIYGIIKGTAVNHGGRTNGFTVPNPDAQAEVIARAMKVAGVDPSRISYVEAHSTGTPLGDPIEIAGLNKAFKGRSPAMPPCFLGSVKSNIGHCESAAGIAGLSKVLLQMRHGQLAPSLHSDVLNPHLGLERTPFEVNRVLREWERPIVEGQPQPRVAGISGFGAGGSNAHLLVEECIPSVDPVDSPTNRGPHVILLSARNEKRLMERAVQLHQFVGSNPSVCLADLAYTLQVGREPMEERLGFVAASRDELLSILQKIIGGNAGHKVRRGRIADGASEALRALVEDEDADLGAAIQRWAKKGRFEKLIELWVRGLEIDWRVLHGTEKLHRISLPTYPFAGDRYWLPESGIVAKSANLGTEKPVEKRWLALHEEWAPAPWPSDTDWTARLHAHKHQRVLLLVADEQEAIEVRTAICQIASQASPENLIALETVLLTDLPTWQMSHAPNVILIAAPFGGSAEADRHHVSQLFALIQRLMREAWDAEIEIYHIFEQSAGQHRLELQALGGLLRSAMLENSNHKWTSIQVENCPATEARALLLLKEWLSAEGSTDQFASVQHRGSERLRLRLTDCHIEPGNSPVFRPKGTYLVAGALGPVGEQLCRELAIRYRARLVLVSRGDFDVTKRRQVRQLEDLGASVTYFQADIADSAALDAAWTKIRTDVGSINGVIHLARQVEDGLLLAKTWETFDRVIRAKVDGTVNLDRVTAAEPLDFFLLFSSMAAYGMRGSSDYAYSSAFQNAFAASRAQRVNAGQRSGQTVACAWGPWTVDKYSKENRDRQFLDAGFSLITVTEAFPWVESQLWGQDPVLGLMQVHDLAKARAELRLNDAPKGSLNLENQIAQWEEQKRQGIEVTESAVAQVISSADVAALNDAITNRLHALFWGNEDPKPKPLDRLENADIKVTIKQCLAEILDLPQVEEAKPFLDYGMNSISAMRFALLLEKRLRKPVLPQLLMEHPTVRALARHLASAAEN